MVGWSAQKCQGGAEGQCAGESDRGEQAERSKQSHGATHDATPVRVERRGQWLSASGGPLLHTMDRQMPKSIGRSPIAPSAHQALATIDSSDPGSRADATISVSWSHSTRKASWPLSERISWYVASAPAASPASTSARTWRGP